MKRLVLFIVVVLFILPVYAYAQAPDTLWTRNYNFGGIDEAWQMKKTPDGGFIIVGSTSINSNICLLKIDENGDTLWTSTLGFTSDDIGRSVEPLEDGGYIITGYAGGYIVLMKADSLGNHLWHHYLDSGWGRAVRVAGNGDFIIAGWTPDSGAAEDFFIARTDSDGDTIWTRTFGGDGFERPWDVRETPDGGFVILGWTQPAGGSSDIYVIRIDASGDSLWSKTYGDAGNDEGRSLLVKDDGGFIIAGKIGSPGAFSEALVINADPNGDTIWTRSYRSSNTTIANSICPTRDGGYILTGVWRDNIEYVFSSMVIKIDENGDSLWSVILEDTFPNRNLYCRSIVQTEDGGYVVAGFHDTPNMDVFLCKLAPDITRIYDETTLLPAEITLHQNYPNPFNASTTISFTLLEPQDVKLSIYDLLGRKILVLADGYFDAGAHEITFDAGDLASGIYFYNLKSEDTGETKSMILLK